MLAESKPAFSASKLRRMRAAATRSRLYQNAMKEQPLYVIQSQLAMLTSSLDHFMYYFKAIFRNASASDVSEHIQSNFSPSAHEFTPPLQHQDEHQTDPVNSDSFAAPCLGTEAASLGILRNQCCTCWEPLPTCHCRVLATCRECFQFHSAVLPSPRQEREDLDQAVEREFEESPENEQVLEILRKSNIEKIDFYPKDWILCIKAEGENSLELCIDKRSFRKIPEVLRSQGLNRKFSSHFNKSLLSNTEDKDWAFLQESLQPSFSQMRLYFHEYLEQHLRVKDSSSTASPTSLSEESRRQAVQSLVGESLAAILASVNSAGAVKMIKRYGARIEALLRGHVEDVFASLGQ